MNDEQRTISYEAYATIQRILGALGHDDLSEPLETVLARAYGQIGTLKYQASVGRSFIEAFTQVHSRIKRQ